MARKSKGITGKLTAITRLRLLPRYLRDGSVSIWRKGLLLLLVAYVLSPVDMIPELFVPFIGWLDDLGVLGLLVAWLYGELGKYSTAEKEKNQLPDESAGNGRAPSSHRLTP